MLQILACWLIHQVLRVHGTVMPGTDCPGQLSRRAIARRNFGNAPLARAGVSALR